jgi:hypothetical protein
MDEASSPAAAAIDGGVVANDIGDPLWLVTCGQ